MFQNNRILEFHFFNFHVISIFHVLLTINCVLGKEEWKFIIGNLFLLKMEISNDSPRHFHFYLIIYFKKFKSVNT